MEIFTMPNLDPDDVITLQLASMILGAMLVLLLGGILYLNRRKKTR